MSWRFTRAEESALKLRAAATTYKDYPLLSEALIQGAAEIDNLRAAVEFARAEGMDWPSDPLPLCDIISEGH